jgi:hypothetical protein
LVTQAAAGAAARSSQVGAWAPWEISRGNSSSRAGGGTVTEHIHPRLLELDQKHPLKVQLGEAVVLHFIATDMQGLPACLNKEQAAMTEKLGLWLLPAALGGAGSSQAPCQQPERGLAGEVVLWFLSSNHDEALDHPGILNSCGQLYTAGHCWLVLCQVIVTEQVAHMKELLPYCAWPVVVLESVSCGTCCWVSSLLADSVVVSWCPAGENTDQHGDVEALAWSWAPGPDDALSTTPTTTSAGAGSSRSCGDLPAGHLGGWCVNAVTFRVVSGCDVCQLSLPLQSSCGLWHLTIPLMVEAGPVAVDGLRVKSINHQQPVQQLQAGQQPPVAGRGRLLSHLQEGLIDRHTWGAVVLGDDDGPDDDGPDENVPDDNEDDDELNGQQQQVAPAGDDDDEGQEMQEAAAAAGVHIKPDPDAVVVVDGSVQQQNLGKVVEVIDLLSDTDDEDDMNDAQPPAAEPAAAGTRSPDHAAEEQQQQQQQQMEKQKGQQDAPRQSKRRMSARAQQLAALDRGAVAWLHRLTVQEGCSLLLQLQLVDDSQHPISADRPGQQLQLVRHEGPQGLPGGRQQSAAGGGLPQQQVPFQHGKASVTLNVGVGDSWLGQQLFELVPSSLSTGATAADGDGGSNGSCGDGDNLNKVLPVLLLLEVQPGPYPCGLELASDVLAELQCVTVEPGAAAGVAAAAVPEVLLAKLGAPAVQQLISSTLSGPVAVLRPDTTTDLNRAAEGQAGNSAASASTPGGGLLLPRMSIRIKARDGRPLAAQGLQPLRLQLLKWAPREVAVSAAAGYSVGPKQLASCWHEVLLGGDPALQVPATSSPAADGHQADGAGQERLVGYEVSCGSVALPPVLGLYKLTASYPQPPAYTAQQDDEPGEPSGTAGCEAYQPHTAEQLLMQSHSQEARATLMTWLSCKCKLCILFWQDVQCHLSMSIIVAGQALMVAAASC